MTDRFLLAAILAIGLVLFTAGNHWGLPGVERARLYYENAAEASREENTFLALRSYHPDEPHLFMALSNMRPSELDFNPHYFIYPTLHIYTLGAALKAADLLGVVKVVPSKEFYFEHPDESGKMYLVGRWLTLCFGLLTLWMTYQLGREMFGRRVGLLAALLLCVMPLFVVDAHYVTVDVPLTFWLMVSLFCARKAVTTESVRWHAAAGFTAGLATATKYNGALVFLALVVPRWWLVGRTEGKPLSLEAIAPRPVRLAVVLAAVAFFLGCPYALIAPRDFFQEGFSILLGDESTETENYHRLYEQFSFGFFYHLYLSLPQGMGLPLFVCGLVGIGWALYRRTSGDLTLLAFVVPHYLLIGLTVWRPMRYVIPLLPILALWTARWTSETFAALRSIRNGPILRAALATVIAASVGYAALDSIAYLGVMTRPETRDEAARWIRSHAEPGAKIGLFFRQAFTTPPLDTRRYDVKVVGLDREAIERELPDVLVMDEIRCRDYLRSKERFPAQAELLQELLSGTFRAGGYRYAPREFRSRPELLGWSFRASVPPHDWLFLSPDVSVLLRETIT